MSAREGDSWQSRLCEVLLSRSCPGRFFYSSQSLAGIDSKADNTHIALYNFVNHHYRYVYTLQQVWHQSSRLGLRMLRARLSLSATTSLRDGPRSRRQWRSTSSSCHKTIHFGGYRSHQIAVRTFGSITHYGYQGYQEDRVPSSPKSNEMDRESQFQRLKTKTSHVFLVTLFLRKYLDGASVIRFMSIHSNPSVYV